jgi:hypothetical protein
LVRSYVGGVRCPMAEKHKCLARSDKSADGAKATKKCAKAQTSMICGSQ